MTGDQIRMTETDPGLAAMVKAAMAAEHEKLMAEVQQVALRAVPAPTTTDDGSQKIAVAIDELNKRAKATDEQLGAFKADIEGKIASIVAQATAPRSPTPLTDTQKRRSLWNAFREAGMEKLVLQNQIRPLGSGENRIAGISLLERFADHGEIDQSAVAGLVQTTVDTEFRGEGIISRPFSSFAPRINVPGNTYLYPREAEESRLCGLRTLLNGGETNVSTKLTVDDATGLAAGMTVIVFDGTTQRPYVVSSLTGTTQINIVGTTGHVLADNLVVTSQEFGGVAESAAKNYSYLKTTQITATLRAVPLLAKFTRQAGVTADVERILRQKLPANLQAALSYLLLYGDGTLPGLMNTTGCQDYDWSDGVTGDGRADAVLRAWAMLRTGGTPRMWCRRENWITLMTAKGASEKGYLQTAFGPVPVTLAGGTPALGWFPVSFDDSLRDGDFLLIDHANAHALVSNPAFASLEMGYVNDDFEQNLATLRYEEMVSQAIYRFGAYVSCDWDSAP